MILKMILGLIVGAIWLQSVSGASYSKVYVQSGQDIIPVEFVNYGAPAVYSDTELARLSASPVKSVVPVSSVSNVIPPCVSPCVVSSPNVAPVATLPNAKILAYNSPNVPVVVAPNVDNGYEYSYVVYDENTGDRKAQREFSDGAVVQGEYSFIQPDGYVREVKYTADDLKGFNVIVKNILPDSVRGVETKIQNKEKSEPVPCVPAKSEALKEEPANQEPEVDAHKGHDHEQGKHEEPITDAHVESVTEEVTNVEINEVEQVSPEPEQNNHTDEPKPEPVQELKPAEPAQEKTTPEVAIVTHEEVHEATAAPQIVPVANAIASYDDIVRCIQARLQAQQGITKPDVSPLTYIILPGSKPC